MKKKDAKKAAWMREFEIEVNSLWPEHAGKVDWNDAIYMWGIGYDTKESAAKYVAASKKEVK